MLKQLSLAVIITVFISGSALAGGGRDNERITREVKLDAGFTKIIVDGDADILLIQGESITATIEDEAADVNSTDITNQNGVLKVQVTGNGSKRPLIKLPVSLLQSLEVNGDGNIRSVSALKSENLNVLINGACKVALRVTGTISVDVSEGFELEYFRKAKIRVVY